MRHATTLAALALLAPAARASILHNGDFELGFDGWTVRNTEHGVGAPGSLETYDIDGFGPLGASRAAVFAVGADPDTWPDHRSGGIEMVQSVYLNAGTTYTMAFDWSVFNKAAQPNLIPGLFAPYIDGDIILDVTGDNGLHDINPHTMGYGALSAGFTVDTSGYHEIGVLIRRSALVPHLGAFPTLLQYVDNVTVTPAPGTPAMLAIATGIIMRRRR